MKILHHWIICLTLIALSSAADRGALLNVEYQAEVFPAQVGSCLEEASARGAALLQTSRSTGTLGLALNKSGGITTYAGHLHQDPRTSILPVSFWKVLLVAAIVVVFGTIVTCTWYNNLWRYFKELGRDAELEGDAKSEATASYHLKRSRSIHFSGDIEIESDESDSGDFFPLRSLGLSKFHSRSVSDTDKAQEDVWIYLEESNTSWTLFFRILGALAQVWGMLGLMYYSLLTKDDELMDCLAHPHGPFVTHLCTYTHACLRGFPILAANVTLTLMIRILVQNRIYYSMLSLGYVVDFADTHVLHTHWPWLFVLSMVQGGAHLLLKMYFDPEPISLESYISLFRKFFVPGAIFLSFFLRYAEIENTLLPLNRLVERDYTKDDRFFPSLASLQALNERVLAFDARTRDVVGDVWDKNEKRPSLADVFQHIIDTYDEASHRFYRNKKHYEWGFFRSLWPAAVLVDTRLDWHEPKTRSWLCVFAILLAGCIVVLFCSVCFFVASIWRNVLLGAQYRISNFGVVTETGLAIVVLLCHFLVVVFFLNRTIRGMFYFDIRYSEVDKKLSKDDVTVVDSREEVAVGLLRRRERVDEDDKSSPVFPSRLRKEEHGVSEAESRGSEDEVVDL